MFIKYIIKRIIYTTAGHQFDEIVPFVDEDTFYRINGTHKSQILEEIVKDNQVVVKMKDREVVLVLA